MCLCEIRCQHFDVNWMVYSKVFMFSCVVLLLLLNPKECCWMLYSVKSWVPEMLFLLFFWFRFLNGIFWKRILFLNKLYTSTFRYRHFTCSRVIVHRPRCAVSHLCSYYRIRLLCSLPHKWNQELQQSPHRPMHSLWVEKFVDFFLFRMWN